MQVQRIDERRMVRERDGASFIVFIYHGGGGSQRSWAVDSRLITDAELPEVLRWLRENLPQDCCWSLGLVREPTQPTTDSDVDVRWIVGSDVLNMDPSDRTHEQQRIAEDMLARRHRVDVG